MRPLFFLIALGTTALAITACKKPEAELAPATDAAAPTPPPETAAPPTATEAMPPAGATTVPEGGTTMPQGGPPPVNPPQ